MIRFKEYSLRYLGILLVVMATFLLSISANAQETLCDDGIDNDSDGLIDCLDADCGASSIGFEDDFGFIQDNVQTANETYLSGAISLALNASSNWSRQGNSGGVSARFNSSDPQFITVSFVFSQPITDFEIKVQDFDGDGVNFYERVLNFNILPTSTAASAQIVGNEVRATQSEAFGILIWENLPPNTTTISFELDKFSPSGNIVLERFKVFTTKCREYCNNHIDDDGDGLADCEDPECADSCLVFTPRINGPSQFCTDSTTAYCASGVNNATGVRWNIPMEYGVFPTGIDPDNGLALDKFTTFQDVEVVANGPNFEFGFISTAPGEALGNSRDMLVLDLSASSQANGKLQTNNNRFSYQSASSTELSAVLTYDGNDSDSTLNPTGLGGIDITEGGSNEFLTYGIYVPNTAFDVIAEIYTDANNWSTHRASQESLQDAFNQTGTFQNFMYKYFLKFEDFQQGGTGPADFTNVGAVRIRVVETTNAFLGTDFIMYDLGFVNSTTQCINLNTSQETTTVLSATAFTTTDTANSNTLDITTLMCDQEVCTDNIDNDGDGLIDCVDEDCFDYCCVDVCENCYTLGGNDLDTKLLLHFDKDQPSDATFEDASPYFNDVTATNITFSDTGRINCNAAVFDGTGYIEIPYSTDFDINGSFTIDFWMKPAQITDSVLLFSQRNREVPGTGIEVWQYGQRLHVRHRADSLVGFSSSTGGAFQVDEWRHVVISRIDGSTIVGRGFNGFGNGGSGAPANLKGDIAPLRFGGNPFSPGRNYRGEIDELRYSTVGRYQAFGGDNAYEVPTGAYGDEGCIGTAKSVVSTGPGGCPEVCDNGVDDDFDGLVDCNDPECGSFVDCQPNLSGPSDPCTNICVDYCYDAVAANEYKWNHNLKGLAEGVSGQSGFFIDRFLTPQSLEPVGNTQAGETSFNAVQTTGNDIVGLERDLFIEQEGSGQLGIIINEFNIGQIASFAVSSGSYGHNTIVYDGVDNSPAINHTGLGGIDVTQSGLNDHLLFRASNEDSMRMIFTIYTDATNFSIDTVHMFGGPRDYLLPLSGFNSAGSNGGADFTNIGAIKLFSDDDEATETAPNGSPSGGALDWIINGFAFVAKTDPICAAIEFTNTNPGTLELSAVYDGGAQSQPSIINYTPQDCPEDCTSGQDEDNDGLTDCQDPDCGGVNFTHSNYFDWAGDGVNKASTEDPNSGLVTTLRTGFSGFLSEEWNATDNLHIEFSGDSNWTTIFVDFSFDRAIDTFILTLRDFDKVGNVVEEQLSGFSVLPNLVTGGFQINGNNVEPTVENNLGKLVWQNLPANTTNISFQITRINTQTDGVLFDMYTVQSQKCPEICNNNIDDDGDGLADCDDQDCFNEQGCAPPAVTIVGPANSCKDIPVTYCITGAAPATNYTWDVSNFVITQGTPVDDADGLSVDKISRSQFIFQDFNLPHIETLANSKLDPEAIGGERDFLLKVRTSPGGNSMYADSTVKFMAFNASAGTVLDAEVIYDGVDGDSTLDYTGLNGVDLTEGGTNNTMFIRFRSDLHVNFVIRIFTDEFNYSDYKLSDIGYVASGLSNGVNDAYIPLSSFASKGANGGVDFTNVGAIQLLHEDGFNRGSVDALFINFAFVPDTYRHCFTIVPSPNNPTTYTVSVFSHNGSGTASNESNGVSTLVEECVELCDNGTDDDQDGKIDCLDEDCAIEDPVVTSPIANQCPATTADLTSAVTSTTPSGASVKYVTSNNPQGTEVADATAVGAGTYYVFYISAEGCPSNGQEVVVNINQCPCVNPPSANITSSLGSSNARCGIAPITLTGTFNNADNANWSIATGNGTLSTTNCTSSGCQVTFTPATTGTHRIRLSTNDPDGSGLCDTASFVILLTVNEIPAAPEVTSPIANVCPATTADLTSAVTSTTPSGGGVRYVTTNNAEGIPVNSPTAVEAGTYYIFYQTDAGCYSSGSEVVVNINQCPCVDPPTASITSSLSNDQGCGTNPVVLTGQFNNADNATWSIVSGQGNLSSSNCASTGCTSTYTPSSIGSHTVRITTNDPDGAGTCEAATFDYTFVINENPDAPTATSPFTNTCPSETADLTEAVTSTMPPGGHVRYVTTNNYEGTLVSDPTAVGAGTYYVFYRTAEFCRSTGTQIVVNINSCSCTNPPTAIVEDVDHCLSEGYSIPLSATVTGASNGVMWSSNGAGTITNPTSALNASYTVVAGDLNMNSITFTITVNDPDGSGPCTEVSDMFVLEKFFTPVVESNTITPATCPACDGSMAFSFNSGINMNGETINVVYTYNGSTIETSAVAAFVNNVNEIVIPDLCAGSYSDIRLFHNGTCASTIVIPNPSVVGPAGGCVEICDNGIDDDGDNLIDDADSDCPSVFAQHDINNTLMGTPVEGNVLTNDGSLVGIDLGIPVIGQQPSNGTVTINGLGAYTYTPNPNFIGEDQFTYTICGSAPNDNICATATVFIEVLPYLEVEGNVAPIANVDVFSTYVNVPISVQLMTNDFDQDGDLTTVSTTLVTPPTNGSATAVNGNTTGEFLYTPANGFVGLDSFRYRLCDPSNLCDEAWAYVYVTNDPNVDGNLPPVGVDDAYITPVNTQIDRNLFDNDLITDGPILFGKIPIFGITNLQGVFTYNSSGEFTYDPKDGFVGSGSFNYAVCDNHDGFIATRKCDTATVYITVQGVPEICDNGLDDDGDGLADNADIECTPIIAVHDIQNVIENQPVEGHVLDNDLLFGIPNVGTPVVITQPSNGGPIVLDAEGDFTYTPNTDYVGEDKFTYRVCGTGSFINVCDTATVFIEVHPEIDNAVNHAPIAFPDVYETYVNQTSNNVTITIDVLATDYDVDGDLLTVDGLLIDDVNNGTLTDNGGGIYEYTPDVGFAGIDSFTYRVCDNVSLPLCDVATVYIYVYGDPVPMGDGHPPIGITETRYVFSPGSISGSVVSNDYDLDNALVLFTSGNMIHIHNLAGSLTFNSNGQYSYTPEVGFSGAGHFQYVVYDPSENPRLHDTVTVYITVFAISEVCDNGQDDDGDGFTDCNDDDCSSLFLCKDLVAINDINNTVAGAPASGNVLTNDDLLGITNIPTPLVIDQPDNGANIVINPDGSYTYTPNPGFVGEDQFSYVVCGNNGSGAQVCDTAFVFIEVLPVVVTGDNDGPIANPDAAQTYVGQPVDINVLGNDFDQDGDNLLVQNVLINPVTNGTLTPNGNGQYTYTPNPGFVGVDSFTYRVCDDGSPSLCDEATVYVYVTPDYNGIGNDAPVAIDDAYITSGTTVVNGNLNSNDSDPNGHTLVYTITPLSGPANGTLQINNGGSFAYTPTGTAPYSDNFVYRVCDNQSPALCDTATAYITVQNTPVEICDNGSDDDGDGFTDCLDSDCQSSGLCASIVISELNVCNQRIELFNTSSAPIDVTNWYLCTTGFQYDRIGDVTNVVVVSGTTIIPAGGYLVLEWSDINTTAGELALYANNNGYSTSANMRDYVQYNSGNNNRASLAVSAGLWDNASTFVEAETGTNCNSIGVDNTLVIVDGTSTNTTSWCIQAPSPGAANNECITCTLEEPKKDNLEVIENNQGIQIRVQ